jgi:ribose/xylose/arabinose/galactoside ABC-type transport system permease subunit
MRQKIGTFISDNQRFIPLTATALLAFVAYAAGVAIYPGMRDPQVFLNLFRTSPFLLISAVGMTFVILAEGIDLSVSGVIALTTVAAAALLREGWNAWVVILLMLALGMALGAIMGVFITYMKVQPFIATLAGMWFARGMCFFISDDAIAINNRIYRILGQTRILIPGLSDPTTKQGAFISILAILALAVLGVAMYIAHYTRFGRTVYAIGGNEQSARLMGLPVNATKVLVYTLSGFCSGLAGIVLSIYVSSGHGLYALGFELDVIAAVVIGGTMLTGGSGYVFGTLFGVLVMGITQTLIQFDGRLSSWWTKIVIGALTLIFIGVQSLLAARQGRRLVGEAQAKGAIAPATRRNRRMLLFGGGAAIVIVLAVLAITGTQQPGGEAVTKTPSSARACQLKPYRQEQATSLMDTGAVLTYERNGGPACIDELYAIYPDGRITGDDGTNEIEEQVPPEEVDRLLVAIDGYGWFTDEMYNTWHTPCAQCYGYYLTVSYNGQEKTVKGVDGGTDAPADYWQVISLVKGIIPKFPPAP